MTRLTLVAAVVAILVGCTAQPSPPDLWKQPESELIFPGSEILAKREREPQSPIQGGRSGSVGYLLGSDGGASAIEDFYAAELLTLGWQPPIDKEAGVRGIRTTAELFARSWRKGDLVFRLGILDKSHPAAEGPSEGFETVFRIDLIDQPPDPDRSP
jgi:hypothetical protein